LNETAIVESVETYLNEQNFKTYTEVPALTKRIDIIGIGEGEIWAVEAKVRNWKQALRQANLDRLFADRVFVALWHEHITGVNEELFDKFGIGIMTVNGTVDIIKEARKSQIMHTSLVNSITESVGNMDG